MIRVMALMLFVRASAYAKMGRRGTRNANGHRLGREHGCKHASSADYIDASTTPAPGRVEERRAQALRKSGGLHEEFAESAQNRLHENSTPYVWACMEKAKKKHPWCSSASVQAPPVKNGIFIDDMIPYVVYSSGWDRKTSTKRLFVRITHAGQDRGTLILAVSHPRPLRSHHIAAASTPGCWRLDQRYCGLLRMSMVKQPASLRLRIRTRRQETFRQKLVME